MAVVVDHRGSSRPLSEWSWPLSVSSSGQVTVWSWPAI